MNLYDYMCDMLPNDHSRQVRASDEVTDRVASKGFKPKNVLDLGCGVGASRAFFSNLCPGMPWTGVDIESSPEVNARTLAGDDFVTYNGVDLPFGDNLFDLVYSVQVFEHVRFPEKVLAEVARVLTKDGLFIGQTSQFEPYHSFSFWNFTIYGWVELCRAAGLEVLCMRPSIDGPTLIERSYLGRPEGHSKWFHQESPLNQEIQEAVDAAKRPARIANFRKLQYCGQFVFVCARA